MAKKGTDYFDIFTQGVAYACDAAGQMRTCFQDYDPAQVHDQIKKVHQIEHAADGVKHDLMARLVREFLPPIEREDIVELANSIDDVTDAIEDVMLRLYMFNITVLRPDVHDFTDIIFRCCTALKEVTLELRNFRKPGQLLERIIQINHLEEEGDRLYAEAMRRLYSEERDPVAVIAWTAMYDRMERCCDRCEDVAVAAERVVMKNN